MSKWSQWIVTEVQTCPVCGGKIVDRLFKRGTKDWLMTFLKCSPYRCRRCYGRFYIRDAAENRT